MKLTLPKIKRRPSDRQRAREIAAAADTAARSGRPWQWH